MKATALSAAIAVLTCATALADFTGRVVGITDGNTVRVMRNGEACSADELTTMTSDASRAEERQSRSLKRVSGLMGRSSNHHRMICP